ncbi:MAG: aspartyl/asparaginyl beta-hydroxylase domain-containing protein [Bryobacteraceae bacterium]|nr:aspartyl/asparaginyl beta-hydroxylase domain-containing protein [Bryobacteraceae bacterium]
MLTQHNLGTALLGQVRRIDQARLSDDLAAIDGMAGNGAYSRYNLVVDPRAAGEWTQVILGNWSGDAADGLSREYQGHFRWTQQGAKAPYVRALVEATFRCEHLKSVRVFLAANAIITAHKDYMEFKRGFRRLHIPLRTNGQCMNSEGAIVYHMKVGGIYFVDGRAAHAGGNLAADRSRVHLVLDFDPEIQVADLFMYPEDFTGGALDVIERPGLSAADLKNIIEALAAVMTPVNYGMIAGLANMLPFTHDFDTAKVYDVLVAAATRCGNSELIARSRADREYFLGVE